MFLSEWFVRNKFLLRRIGVILFAIFGIGLFVYSFFMWGWYLIIGFREDKLAFSELVQTVTNYENIQENYAATPLSIGSVRIFETGNGKNSFVVPVKNTNKKHIAEITYYFLYQDGRTANRTGIILPESERPFYFIGQNTSSTPREGKFVMESMSWNRIDPHKIFDPKSFIDARHMFEVEDFLFARGSSIEGIPTNQIAFALTNNSVYSYWNQIFSVELFDGGELVDILQIEFDTFLLGERKDVHIGTLSQVNGATSVRVTPLSNPFDENIFLPPEP